MNEKIDGWRYGKTGKRAADSDIQGVPDEKNAALQIIVKNVLICATDEDVRSEIRIMNL